jgi:hypothetical protein
MSTETLNKNIAALETAISLVEKRLAETHSGVDQLLLNSFIIETRGVLEVLNTHKPIETVVFNYVQSPEA